MPDDSLLVAIRDVGVPAVIVLIMLLRLEPKLDKLATAIEHLETCLSALVGKDVLHTTKSEKGRE